ncbi:hypothetical protein [Curtobacterium sp. 9128]|uniref:hypothetical protein n=1 Tax=Curtobacterium sp. 9128 TaxID=1793722 RepID=UPI0021B1F6D9|nr:hypothetical protein [Curtobacterium sp. 9128]
MTDDDVRLWPDSTAPGLIAATDPAAATDLTGATDPTTAHVVAVHRDGDTLVLRAPAWSLTIRDAGERFRSAPSAVLRGADGRRWADLCLLAGVDTTGGADETTSVGLPSVRPDGDGVVLTVACGSSVWGRRSTVLRCRPTHVELTVEVEGGPSDGGAVTDVTVLGGEATLPSGAAGAFRSAMRFRGVFVPAATEPVRLVRPAAVPAVLGVVGDAAPGRLSAVFSPPPLVYGLVRAVPDGATAVPGGDALGIGVRAPVADQTFTGFHHEPLDGGFRLRLAYEGHTVARDGWRSPVVVLRPASDPWQVLDDHRADLVATGCAPDTAPAHPDWWTEPVFCGWGAQSARSSALLRRAAVASAPTDDAAVVVPEGDEDDADVARLAPTFARADVYDGFLDRLREHGLRPGTVVVDDRWQREYGTGVVDTDAWPDLGGWVRTRHDAGQRVLLWWKAWDVEGLPAAECVRDRDGRPVSVDPGSPAYRERLTGIVRHLLGPDGIDADGFKVDFTQRGPSGTTLRGGGGSWGIALLHELLRVLVDAARSVKPDALVVTHTVHPGFADVTSMVRLNDVAKDDPEGRPVPVVDQLEMRHAIVRRTLPHHPVDTDQWPMPNRAEWLRYVARQGELGVPALYYLESIDRSGEPIADADLREVAATWERYRTLRSSGRGRSA